MIHDLCDAGIAVYSVYESDRGISDEAIIERSRRPPRIILTEDKDFEEWVFAHGIKSISVFLMRYSHREQAMMSRTLIELLKEKGDKVYGMFVTVTPERIHYRSIYLNTGFPLRHHMVNLV